jgi:hypothetical protein
MHYCCVVGVLTSLSYAGTRGGLGQAQRFPLLIITAGGELVTEQWGATLLCGALLCNGVGALRHLHAPQDAGTHDQPPMSNALVHRGTKGN